MIPGDELVTSIRPVDLVEERTRSRSSQRSTASRGSARSRRSRWPNEGVRTDAAAVVGKDLLDDGRLRILAGDREDALTALDDGGATILPPARSPSARGSGVGEHVLDHARQRQVAGAAGRRRSPSGRCPGRAGEAALVGWSDATEALGVAGADVFAIRYEPGREAEPGRRLEETRPGLALEPNPLDRVAGAVDAALGRVFGLFDALAIIAVIVAALGIVNTLTMNVLERVREIGVLRAAGMTTRQVRRTVVVEAGILGRRRVDPRDPDGHRRGRVMVAIAGGDAAARVRAAVGLDRPRRRPGDRPVDARRLVPGPPGQPPGDRPGGPARVIAEC